MDIQQKIGIRIRELRIQRKLSQEAFVDLGCFDKINYNFIGWKEGSLLFLITKFNIFKKRKFSNSQKLE